MMGPLGKSRHVCADNIRLDLGEIGRGRGNDWTGWPRIGISGKLL
jgi:hypothetical protein